METVESILPPREPVDSDQEWERVDDDVTIAATLAQNVAAHEDEVANNALSSFTSLSVDDAPLETKLEEMDAALARLLSNGSEKVEVKEAVAPTGDFVPEVGPPSKDKDAAMDGFPDDFPGISKKSADLAKQFTKEEIVAQQKMLAANYNKAGAGIGHGKLGQLSRGARVQGKCKLCGKEVIAVDKGPPTAQIKLGESTWFMFCGPEGVSWHTDADEAQKEAAAVDLGSWAQPPPKPSDQSELSFADQVPLALRLSLAHTVAKQPFDEVQFAKKTAGERPHIQEDWQPSQETRAFHPQLAAAMDIQKKRAGPVDQRPSKETEEEFMNKLNPQLDVMTQMQAGAHEVADAPGASVLRRLDIENLRSLLKRNYLQGPGQQGEEFFAAQTSLEADRASNKRMQEEGELRAKLLKPVVETIDTWGPQLRAALEMNVFNPDTPLKDMEFDDIEALRDRYLNTKFLLGQKRNPFPASLLQELPSLAAIQGEGERVARDDDRGLSSTGAFGLEEQSPEAVLGVPVGSMEYQIMRLKRLVELHLGEQRMIGGKWKRAEQVMLEMRTHPRTFRSPFFEPIALAMEEIESQDDDSNFHWQKEVQTWDLISLFSTFGHSYTAHHLYAVWSHLPITIKGHKRGAKNKEANSQRRDDFRAIQKEAKEFVLLHDLPAPTTDLEWKQLYRKMGSFFAAKTFLSRTPQVVLDMPVSDVHDSK
ncbi:unnamed protein product, partial [Symbiodinium sp. CCMP2456]